MGDFRELPQALDQGLFNAVGGPVRLAGSGQIHTHDPILNSCFAVTSKTIHLGQQPALAFGISRALEVFVQDRTDGIGIRTVIPRDSLDRRWDAADNIPFLGEINRYSFPNRGTSRC